MECLIDEKGKARPHHEPIPGVYFPAAAFGPERLPSELARMFPRSHYPRLWDLYPRAFPADEWRP